MSNDVNNYFELNSSKKIPKLVEQKNITSQSRNLRITICSIKEIIRKLVVKFPKKTIEAENLPLGRARAGFYSSSNKNQSSNMLYQNTIEYIANSGTTDHFIDLSC